MVKYRKKNEWRNIMSANIYDTATQLEREIRATDQYKALQEAFAGLKEKPEAYALFKEFQVFQQTLQQKMMNGEEMTEEDAQKAQELTTSVQGEAGIAELMEAEQAFSLLVNDMNKIVMAPVRELYEEE
jgi:cell fate (sporulation/competence/biofilm development) regulator YlbF (YheA/YmcA/DUF963 family)